MAAKKVQKAKIPYVAVYFVDLKLFSKVAVEAAAQHRKLSPMIIAMIREYFDRKENAHDVNPNAA